MERAAGGSRTVDSCTAGGSGQATPARSHVDESDESMCQALSRQRRPQDAEAAAARDVFVKATCVPAVTD